LGDWVALESEESKKLQNLIARFNGFDVRRMPSFAVLDDDITNQGIRRWIPTVRFRKMSSNVRE
jgi:hypothetical protein